MAFLIKQIFDFIICFLFFLLLLGIIGVKMKTIFVEVQAEDTTVYINTDHITVIVKDEEKKQWSLFVSDSKDPIFLQEESANKLFDVIKIVKL